MTNVSSQPMYKDIKVCAHSLVIQTGGKTISMCFVSFKKVVCCISRQSPAKAAGKLYV